MSAMAVSDSNMFGGGTAVCMGGARDGGGVGLQTGLEYKVAKAVYARSNFNLFMPSTAHFVRSRSHPNLCFYSAWDQQGWIG